MHLNEDFTKRAVVHVAKLEWKPSPMPGVPRTCADVTRRLMVGKKQPLPPSRTRLSVDRDCPATMIVSRGTIIREWF